MTLHDVNYTTAFLTAAAYQTYCRLKFSRCSELCTAISINQRAHVLHILASETICAARDVSLVAPRMTRLSSDLDPRTSHCLAFPSMSIKATDPYHTEGGIFEARVGLHNFLEIFWSILIYF